MHELVKIIKYVTLQTITSIFVVNVKYLGDTSVNQDTDVQAKAKIDVEFCHAQARKFSFTPERRMVVLQTERRTMKIIEAVQGYQSKVGSLLSFVCDTFTQHTFIKPEIKSDTQNLDYNECVFTKSATAQLTGCFV